MSSRTRILPSFYAALSVVFVAQTAGYALVQPAPVAAAPAESHSRITTPTGSVTVPLTIKSGTLYVDAQVNGKPARFILDTGASVNVLTPEAARRLGVESDGSRGTVTGAATVEARRGIVDKLSIVTADGEAVQEKQTAIIAALPEELKCDGLIGGTYLSQWVVTVDYLTARLTLTDARRFAKPAKAFSLPLTFSRGIPAVAASLDNLSGIFRIDTGANDSLTLFGPWVEKNKLRDKYTRRIKTVTGQGLGGLLYGELVRLPAFRLGDVSIKNVIGELSSNDQSSAFYDDKVAGNIGASIWRRFTLTIDYPGQRVYLEKNSDFEVPFLPNRSGLSTSFNQGLMQIIDVVANSPASEAGLHIGDTVLAMNGVGIDRMDPDEARLRLRAEPGTVVDLTVRTGSGAPRNVKITLRDLL